MKFVKIFAKKNVTPLVTSKRHHPLQLEPLEPRCLLNGDWTGLWALNGYSFLLEYDDFGQPDFDVAMLTRSLSIKESYGGYEVQVIGEQDSFFFFELSPGILKTWEAGYDGDDYYQLGMSMVQLNDNVALLVGGEVGYDSIDMNDIYWADSWFGVMTQGFVSTTPRPWSGEYSYKSYNISLDDSGVSADEDDGLMDISDLGGGQYLTDPIGNAALGNIYNQTGSVLVYQDEVLISPDTVLAANSWVRRGPDDTLIVLWAEGSYNTDSMTIEGLDTAVIILEPLPDYQYKPDLTGTIIMQNVPASTLPGGKFTVPVTVTNSGSAPLSGFVGLDVSVHDNNWAPGYDPGWETLIGSANAFLSLQPGRQTTVNIPAVLPNNMDYGDYALQVELDTKDAVTETDTGEENNTVLSATEFEVAQPQRDLTGTINLGTWTTAMGGDRGSIRIIIKNEGNISLSGSIDLNLYLSDSQQLDGGETLVASYADQYVSLAANQSTTLYKFITLPVGLPTDDYYLVADLDSNNDIAEVNETNNEAPSTSTINVAEAYVDLAASINQRGWTEAMGGDRGLIFINVANQGNTTARGTTDITIYTSTDETLDGGDTQITELTDQSVYLLPGSNRSFFTFVTLPVGLPTDDYYLLAQIEPAPALNDTNTTNHLAASDPINIEEAFVDLSGRFGTITFLSQLNLGIISMSVANSGNVTATGNMDLELWATNDGTLDGTGDYLLKTLTDQRLYALPGYSQSYFTLFNLPDTILAGSYQFAVKIDSNNDITETDETNNIFLSTNSYTVD